MDCPPPLISMETVVLPNDDGSVMVVSTADTETRLVVSSYDLWLDEKQATVVGSVEMTNKRQTRSKIKYVWRRAIADSVRPVLSEGSQVCYDYESSMLTVMIESTLDPGAVQSEPLDWQVPLYAAADINQDGKVDGDDRGLLFIDWGTNSQRSDLDRDGVVQGGDLGVLNASWGWTAPEL